MRADRIACAALIAAVAGCGGGPPPESAPVPVTLALPATEPIAQPRASAPRSYAMLDTAASRITILLATTRRSVASEVPAGRYTGDDADSLQFAAVAVNVPPYRSRGNGELPRKSSLSSAFGSTADPDHEFFVASTIPADSARFVQRLAGDLASTKSRDVLVFVHGFNVSFEDAALRAAQVAADMSFDGTVVLFSWPSAASVSSYLRDLQAARNAGYHLLRLLRSVIPAAAPDRIHIIAHSMGSEVLGKAIALAAGDTTLRLAQVAFAAPDIDARTFRREVLPGLVSRSTHITLYASSDDDALRASRAVNGVWRLGLGGDSLTVVNGMDTIDASRVRGDALGHTLFGNPAFISDLAQLIGEGRSPTERRLLAVKRGDLTFWRFRGDAR